LRRIGKQCTKLKSIRLVDCVALTDTQIQFLAKNCSKLWSIELEGCKYVSDIGLNYFATHLRKTLKSITLKGLPLITVKGLESFLSKCDQMNSVTIVNCDLLNPETVKIEDTLERFKLKQLKVL
jgi:Tfp pilus assembly protein PilP